MQIILPKELDAFISKNIQDQSHKEFFLNKLKEINSEQLIFKKKRFGKKVIFSIDANYGRHYHRLLFCPISYLGRTAALLFAIAWNHNYQDALNKIPKYKVLENLNDFDLIEREDAPIEDSPFITQYQDQWYELSEYQSKILSATQLPQLLVGPPGSGKTLLSLAFLQEQALRHSANMDTKEFKFLYLTQTAELKKVVSSSWINWAEKNLESPGIILECKTIEELFRENYKQAPLFAKSDLEQLIRLKLARNKQFNYSIDIIIAELFINAHLLFADTKLKYPFENSDYQKSGINQSLLSKQHKKSFYEFITPIISDLIANQRLIPGIFPLNSNSINELYDLTVFDEAQNNTTQELLYAMQITQNQQVLILGDSLQKAAIKISSLSLIASTFYRIYQKSMPIATLKETHRLKPSVAALANEIVLLYNQLKHGLADNTSYGSIVSAAAASSCTLPENDSALTLVQSPPNTEFHCFGQSITAAAIILDEADRETAKKIIGNGSVFTANEAQGLQFSDLFLFISQKTMQSFTVLSKKMQEQQIESMVILEPKKHATIHKGLIDDTCFEILSKLYVALSRTTANAWIYIEPQTDKALKFQLQTFECWLRAKFVPREHRQLDIQISTPEDWLEGINKLIRENALEQAKSHLEVHFGFSKEEAVKYVENNQLKSTITDLLEWKALQTKPPSVKACVKNTIIDSAFLLEKIKERQLQRITESMASIAQNGLQPAKFIKDKCISSSAAEESMSVNFMNLTNATAAQRNLGLEIAVYEERTGIYGICLRRMWSFQTSSAPFNEISQRLMNSMVFILAPPKASRTCQEYNPQENITKQFSVNCYTTSDDIGGNANRSYLLTKFIPQGISDHLFEVKTKSSVPLSDILSILVPVHLVKLAKAHFPKIQITPVYPKATTLNALTSSQKKIHDEQLSTPLTIEAPDYYAALDQWQSSNKKLKFSLHCARLATPFDFDLRPISRHHLSKIKLHALKANVICSYPDNSAWILLDRKHSFSFKKFIENYLLRAHTTEDKNFLECLKIQFSSLIQIQETVLQARKGLELKLAHHLSPQQQKLLEFYQVKQLPHPHLPQVHYLCIPTTQVEIATRIIAQFPQLQIEASKKIIAVTNGFWARKHLHKQQPESETAPITAATLFAKLKERQQQRIAESMSSIAQSGIQPVQFIKDKCIRSGKPIPNSEHVLSINSINMQNVPVDERAQILQLAVYEEFSGIYGRCIDRLWSLQNREHPSREISERLLNSIVFILKPPKDFLLLQKQHINHTMGIPRRLLGELSIAMPSSIHFFESKTESSYQMDQVLAILVPVELVSLAQIHFSNLTIIPVQKKLQPLAALTSMSELLHGDKIDKKIIVDAPDYLTALDEWQQKTRTMQFSLHCVRLATHLDFDIRPITNLTTAKQIIKDTRAYVIETHPNGISWLIVDRKHSFNLANSMEKYIQREQDPFIRSSIEQRNATLSDLIQIQKELTDTRKGFTFQLVHNLNSEQYRLLEEQKCALIPHPYLSNSHYLCISSTQFALATSIIQRKPQEHMEKQFQH